MCPNVTKEYVHCTVPYIGKDTACIFTTAGNIQSIGVDMMTAGVVSGSSIIPLSLW